MLHRRQMFLACTSLLVAGLSASCASSDGASIASGETTASAEAAAFDVASRSHDHAVIARTSDGLVRGIETAATRVFRGVPFAAAPIGDLRWRPPQRHAGWHGVRDATRFAPHCPQNASPFGAASTSEDCLFLNVWSPARHFGPKPVMVWIHGGALLTGESDDYDATRMVDEGDVVVVTINYRLGALGFLAHPALTAESPDHASGNYGLMDQQEALRWVRRNIASFGGDPSRVTIFGESAGGLSVSTHLASQGSQGLFHRAIIESGAYQLTQPALATVEASGAAFANVAGCVDQTAACLRALPVEAVLANQPSGIDGASPVIDGKLLTQSIGAALAKGDFNRVPVMAGANHDEWRLFVAEAVLAAGPTPPALYAASIQATLGIPAALVPLFLAQYPLASYPSADLALAALGTDGIFDCNARLTQKLLSQFVPTFAYEFNDPNAPQRLLPPVSFPYASAHASELGYLFDLPTTVPAPALDADQERLAATMVSYWTAFAHTGQPNSLRTPRWDPFETAIDNTQALVPTGAHGETTFATDHKCAFWDSLRR